MFYLKKVIILVLFFAVIACKKKTTQNVSQNPVPSIPVNITIYPNDPLNFKIQSIGGWNYIDGGLNGIILYRKSQEEFVAIERTSSYLPDNATARVKVMSDNFTLRDSVSDSRWRMFDGSVTQGPAQWSLRLYGTSYNTNTGTLRISN
jgi:hypothetical protein